MSYSIRVKNTEQHDNTFYAFCKVKRNALAYPCSATISKHLNRRTVQSPVFISFGHKVGRQKWLSTVGGGLDQKLASSRQN